MTPEYRAEKEASVTNLGGGDLWEINHVTLVAPAAYFLWAILQAKQGFFKSYTFPVIFCDFLLQCCAILLAITIYGSAPQVLNGLLILPALAAFLQPTVTDTSAASTAQAQAKKDDDLAQAQGKDAMPTKPFITAYRGSMMIVTCASILAVDFPVFPRRFAKTESFGTSLMDLGVGSFVFAAGIVAARQQLKELDSKPYPYVKRFMSAVRHSLPLFGLGFARLLSVKNLDYVEHVSEYGVHWNFFFTLALLPLAAAFLQPLIRIVPSLGGLAFFIACVYEIILFFTPNLKVYIILSERIPGDWMSQNREGVFSMIGYFAIFLAGMGIGMHILPRDPDQAEQPTTSVGGSNNSIIATASTASKPGPGEKDVLDEDPEWLASVLVGTNPPREQPIEIPQFKPEMPKTTLAYLVKWTGLWFLFSVWAMWRYGPRLFVSRRMANLAYIVWVCTFNSAQLLLFCLIDSFVFPGLYSARTRDTERSRIQEATNKVMRAYNRNGLVVFLAANLLTGLINLLVPTLHMGEWESMAILISYLAILTAFALFLDQRNISIKV